eukprot:2283185-Rhodomonas_salina.1
MSQASKQEPRRQVESPKMFNHSHPQHGSAVSWQAQRYRSRCRSLVVLKRGRGGADAGAFGGTEMGVTKAGAYGGTEMGVSEMGACGGTEMGAFGSTDMMGSYGGAEAGAHGGTEMR